MRTAEKGHKGDILEPKKQSGVRLEDQLKKRNQDDH